MVGKIGCSGAGVHPELAPSLGNSTLYRGETLTPEPSQSFAADGIAGDCDGCLRRTSHVLAANRSIGRGARRLDAHPFPLPPYRSKLRPIPDNNRPSEVQLRDLGHFSPYGIRRTTCGRDKLPSLVSVSEHDISRTEKSSCCSLHAAMILCFLHISPRF